MTKHAGANLVLLVDDSEADRHLMEALLEKAGINSQRVAFASAVEAMGFLVGLKSPPGLIVTDLRMPGMDGFQFIAWLRRDPRYSNTRIVCLSGEPGHNAVARAIGLGADGFLAKFPRPQDFQRLWASFLTEKKSNSGAAAGPI